MNVQLKSRLTVLGKRLLPMLVMVCLFAMPALLFGQNPEDNPAGNPDGTPPAVPLSQWMGLMLLVSGVVLSVWVMKRRNAKKAQSLVAQAVTDNQ